MAQALTEAPVVHPEPGEAEQVSLDSRGGAGFQWSWGPDDELEEEHGAAGPAEEELGEDWGQGRPRPKRRRLRVVLLAISLVIVAVVSVGYVRVDGDINPGGPLGPAVNVTVPAGASTFRIGDLLAKAGVVHWGTLFAIYVKVKGAGPLLAGTYTLRGNESYGAVVSELEKGPIAVSYRLTIPEGFTVNQVAETVARLHAGITAAQFLAAADGGRVRSIYEPAGVNSLEGFLFPATYPVPRGETALELVRWLVSTFDARAARAGLAQAAERLRKSPYQVLKVASIVEREAKLDQDRGPIASAIYNRLAEGIPIGAESTLLYGLGNPSGTVSMTTPSPYNTLLHKGLPPTPISNPGLPSLHAAMAPPQTSYLYWVEVNPDGKMGFATTAGHFRQLQLECQAAKLC